KRNRPDRPVLRSHHRIHSALPARAAQSRQNAHRKESGKPMNAVEFRCLVLSFFRSGSATEPSLYVFGNELGEMPFQQPLIDPRFHSWIIWSRLDFFYDATKFKSVAARDRFEHMPCRNAVESLLRVDRN